MFEAPGFPWLLRHELRVLWRSSILMRTHRHVIVPMLVVGSLFQGVALLLARQVVAHPIAGGEMMLAANINIVFLFALMFSRAMTASIDVIYGRGDADFLLASPIPPGRVLAVRMLGVAASIAAPWVLLGGVLGNALAVYGQFWGLCVYPMFFAEAVLVAAIAFAVVVILLRFISPQATRRIGHSLALLTGVGIFIIGQLPRFLPKATLAHFWFALLPGANGGGLAFLFARGLLGEPSALAAAVAFALAGFCTVWFCLAKPFAAGVITAAASRPRGRADAQSGKFRGSPFAASLAKDLRLLGRFPGIVTQIIYRSLTLVPVALILAGRFHMGGGVGGSMAATVPLLVFLAGQLGLFFISVLAGCETIPELALTAPVPSSTPQRAALAASGYATVFIIAAPALAVLARDPGLLPALILGVGGVLLCNLVLGQKMPIPLVRAAFGKTSTGTVLGLILGVSVSSVWAFLIWLLVAPNPLTWLVNSNS
jgi:ABC-2 type transport system permease protein